MQLELHTAPMSPFARPVELALEMKGLAFTRHTPALEDIRHADFRALNPLGRIPVLVVDGVAFPEAQLICEFIEEAFPAQPLLPGDPVGRFRARLLARLADTYISGPAVQLVQNTSGEAGAALAAQAIDQIERGIAGLERWLAGPLYAAGEARSLADCFLPPALFSLGKALPALGISNVPALGLKAAAYLENIRQDEIVGACLASLEAGLAERVARA